MPWHDSAATQRRKSLQALDPLIGYQEIPNFVNLENTARLVITQDSEDAKTDQACARACWNEPRCKAFQSHSETPHCSMFSNRLEYDTDWAYFEKDLTASDAEQEDNLSHEQVFDAELEQQLIEGTELIARQATYLSPQLVQEAQLEATVDAAEGELLEATEASESGRTADSPSSVAQAATEAGDELGEARSALTVVQQNLTETRLPLEELVDALDAARAKKVKLSGSEQTDLLDRLDRVTAHAQLLVKPPPAVPRPPPPPRVPSLRGPGTYTIEVTTARIAGAESEASIEIQLVGTKGKSDTVLIRNAPAMSQQATVKIEVPMDIGRIKQATLQLKPLIPLKGKPVKPTSWTACMVKVVNKKVDGGNGGVATAVPMSPIRTKSKSKVRFGSGSSTRCFARGQEGCASCIDSSYTSCLSCKRNYFLANLRRSCGADSAVSGMCQKYPKPGSPPIVHCKPDFDSTIGAASPEEERETMCTKGASSWLFFKVNEFAHSSFPKRILAISTQLYKRVSCEYKQPEPKKAQCVNSKAGQCTLLCYMTSLQSDSASDLKYTENNRLKCESSRRYPATEVEIDSADHLGKACCYKDCDITKNPNIEKVVPGIKSMVVPKDDPGAWSQMAVISF